MKIVVTGATAGFGLAIARALVEQGHTVIGTGRRIERLQALERELGARFIGLPLDVCVRAEVDAVFAQIAEEVGAIDALVNNAGLALGLDPAQQAALDDWESMVDTNIKGLMYCTRAVLPGMVARNHGWIINLGSTAGTYPYPGGNVYGATKAFVHQFSLGLRADLAGRNVRVTSLEPGLCGGTEFSVTRFKGDRDQAQQVYDGVDPISAADLAATVSWLLSLPAHVNINAIEMMPTCQAPGPLLVKRGGPAA